MANHKTPVTYFDRIYHGADYNPEQWPESIWDDDVRLMGEAHVNIATLPVFGWVSLEPEEGVYTFEWLDRIVEKLAAGGISVCMATATASVPAWLDQKYPDVLRVDDMGRKMMHGSRHTFCPNSANFRRLATTLAGKIAERYGQNPAVKVWHISNEYGNHCYCGQCAAAFRDWLGERYGSLDEVNRRWYTRFWGKTFTEWSQIEPPVKEIGERSIQALLIDYDRFQSDSILACCVAERDTIRKHSRPAIPITTNMMGAFKPLNYQRWALELDIVSWDSYPRRDTPVAHTAMHHSLMRGLKEGQPFMLMEQTPSQTNWQPQNRLKPPGLMRLLSYQAIAHGAETIMYFQWRRSRGATEKHHGAIVEHAARTDARVFQEVTALGRELEALGSRTLGGRVQAGAALLFDWDNWWAIEYSAGPSNEIKYSHQAEAYYSALFASGITADVISPSADLSGYKVVVAPILYMLKPGVAENLIRFVERGGTFVATYISGYVDETDLVFEGGYPGPLRGLLGIWVEEIESLAPGEPNGVRLTDGPLAGQAFASYLVCDRIHCERGARPIAAFTRDFIAGEPAVTVNHYSQGKAYYLGTQIEPEGIAMLLQAICAEAGVQPPLGERPPVGIEIVQRARPADPASLLTYVLNHTGEPARVPLGRLGPQRDLLTGTEAHGELTLAGYGAAILEAAG